MTQFNAAQARNLVDEAYAAHSEYLKEEIQECLKYIENAAKTGKGSMTYYKTDEVIIDRLKLLGFGVRVVSDARDGDFLTITW